MITVSVLASAKINQKKVARHLVRAGYTAVPQDGGLVISPGSVTVTAAELTGLPPSSLEVAEHLLGLAPRAAVTCTFDGPAGDAESWPVVVAVARAVAGQVPLAVLDDHAGVSYLVDAARGLIPPAEYEQIRGRPATSEVLRRLLGN